MMSDGLLGGRTTSLNQQRRRADRDMVTWQDEFIRLSELHRHEVERWLEGANNANAIINAGEAEKGFLVRWLAAGVPGRNEQMPE